MTEEIICPFCRAPANMISHIDSESIIGVDAFGVGWEMYILTFLCGDCDTKFCIDLDPKKIKELVE